MKKTFTLADLLAGIPQCGEQMRFDSSACFMRYFCFHIAYSHAKQINQSSGHQIQSNFQLRTATAKNKHAHASTPKKKLRLSPKLGAP